MKNGTFSCLFLKRGISPQPSPTTTLTFWFDSIWCDIHRGRQLRTQFLILKKPTEYLLVSSALFYEDYGKMYYMYLWHHNYPFESKIQNLCIYYFFGNFRGKKMKQCMFYIYQTLCKVFDIPLFNITITDIMNR